MQRKVLLGVSKFLKKKRAQDLPGLLWHNHDRKLSCLLMPKCASNSIRVMTGCHAGPSHKRYKNYQAFAVIRNPVDRYISAFMEVMIPASDYPRGRYHHENLGLDKDLVQILDDINQGNAGERIVRFTDLILEKGFFEIHTKPQHYFLDGYGGISLYKLENYHLCWKTSGLSRKPLRTGRSLSVSRRSLQTCLRPMPSFTIRCAGFMHKI